RRHTHFRIAHGGSSIPINRAEITLPIHQRIAHRKVLRHTHHSVVDRLVAVRVIFAQHLAHHPGRLAIGPVRIEAHIVHGVQNTPLHRLQPIAHIGKRARDNHAHGVTQIGVTHLIVDVNLLNCTEFHHLPLEQITTRNNYGANIWCLRNASKGGRRIEGSKTASPLWRGRLIGATCAATRLPVYHSSGDSTYNTPSSTFVR